MNSRPPAAEVARRSRAESYSILHDLPEEILIQILIRLRVKSLLRFRSVCKSWNTLITDPTFTQVHLETSSQNSSYIILSYCEFKRHYTIRNDDESFGEYFKPHLPSHLDQSLEMHGSCNGLICLSNSKKDIIYLWNPALRKLKTLPKPINKVYRTYIAYGFLPEVNDYKVVRILCVGRERDKPYKNQFLTEVYSLSADSWRRIDDVPPCYFVCQRPAIVNGAAYWVANKRTDDEVYLFVRLKMGDEVFEEVMLPDGARPCYPYNSLLVLGESVCLFGYNDDEDSYEIWTMECGKMTGSWTKKITVNFRNAPKNLLGVRKNAELLKVDHKQDLVSYNFETQRVKELGIKAASLTFCAYSYVESLIQLAGAETVFPPDIGNQKCELAEKDKKIKIK